MSKHRVRRALRGGSYASVTRGLRTTFYFWGEPEDRYRRYGFRIVVIGKGKP